MYRCQDPVFNWIVFDNYHDQCRQICCDHYEIIWPDIRTEEMILNITWRCCMRGCGQLLLAAIEVRYSYSDKYIYDIYLNVNTEWLSRLGLQFVLEGNCHLVVYSIADLKVIHVLLYNPVSYVQITFISCDLLRPRLFSFTCFGSFLFWLWLVNVSIWDEG